MPLYTTYQSENKKYDLLIVKYLKFNYNCGYVWFRVETEKISDTLLFRNLTAFYHRNQTINRKGTYILADIHGTDHFRTKLAPQPYNKLESCVSKIHTPMVVVWFGNV
jgi:hypothetical protein